MGNQEKLATYIIQDEEKKKKTQHNANVVHHYTHRNSIKVKKKKE